MPKMDTGSTPNLEGNKAREIPTAIPNILPKACPLGPSSSYEHQPLSGPHISQQSPVSKDNSLPLPKSPKPFSQYIFIKQDRFLTANPSPGT
jgi:hypothetical protein